MKMQTLMHNAMAGFDVRKEMEEFERSLPPGFRERVMSLMAGQMGASETFPSELSPASTSPTAPISSTDTEMSIREARLTILRGVAAGKVTPEDAEQLLRQV